MVKKGKLTGFVVQLHELGILEIHFNRPEALNATTVALKRDLIETILQAQMDHRVRVVIFTSEGRAFIAGDDLKNYVSDKPNQESLMAEIPALHDNPIGTYEGLRNISQALNAAIRKLDKLTICAINGYAIQTGLSLALCCDFRIASSNAKLGSATLRYALLPDEGGHYLLVHTLGVSKTMDFLMRKRIVTAEEALELGLVHEIVPAQVLKERTMELARELAEGPQVAMRLLKRAIYNAAEQSFEQACDDIAAKTGLVDHHPDARDGQKAFVEKRQPRFNEWLQEHL